MATALAGSAPATGLPRVKDMRVAIVKAEWNDAVTGRLTESAVRTLRGAGLPETDIDVFEVPGAVELTFAASQLIEASLYDAVIVFG